MIRREVAIVGIGQTAYAKALPATAWGISRRTLDARGTKYSTLVLDGSPVDATDVIVLGVNQAQRAGSEVWWRADLQPAAEAATQRKKP